MSHLPRRLGSNQPPRRRDATFGHGSELKLDVPRRRNQPQGASDNTITSTPLSALYLAPVCYRPRASAAPVSLAAFHVSLVSKALYVSKAGHNGRLESAPGCLCKDGGPGSHTFRKHTRAHTHTQGEVFVMTSQSRWLLVYHSCR